MVDSERETPGNRRYLIAVRPDQKRLRYVFVADAPDQRPPARVVVREDAQQVSKAPGKAVGTVVLLGVGIA